MCLQALRVPKDSHLVVVGEDDNIVLAKLGFALAAAHRCPHPSTPTTGD